MGTEKAKDELVKAVEAAKSGAKVEAVDKVQANKAYADWMIEEVETKKAGHTDLRRL